MMLPMKQTSLEPGLLQFLRLFIVVATVLQPILWRLYSPLLGSEISLVQFIRPTLPVLAFLVIYTAFPAWQQKMGRAFLPTDCSHFVCGAGHFRKLSSPAEPGPTSSTGDGHADIHAAPVGHVPGFGIVGCVAV